MDAVKSFNSELSSLYEVKPPISKAKMTAITRGAIKAIKFYKHVVQSVEKFILKCKSEYKVPGLYVIDSIVRQSRHQFGADKDVFAPRFTKNMQQTFLNLFKCPPEDKSKIIRVLNLWQKNQVFPPDAIQPLFDLADPNHPIHKELSAAAAVAAAQSNGLGNSGMTNNMAKGSPALQKTPTKVPQQGASDTSNMSQHGSSTPATLDQNTIAQLQQLHKLLIRQGGDSATKSDQPVHFDRKLLDFDYGSDEEEDPANSSPKYVNPPNPAYNTTAIESVGSLLTNPEVLRQLQTLQNSILQQGTHSEIDLEKLRKLQEMKQQEEEFDKHLAQTVPNLPFAAECEFKPNTNSPAVLPGYFLPVGADLSQPPPGYKSSQSYDIPPPQEEGTMESEVEFVSGNDNDVEVRDSDYENKVITLDHGDSRSPSPRDDRYNRRRRSRSRERSRERGRERRSRRSSRSRSRSRSRRHRTRSRDRDREKEKEREKEREKDKERKKRGLPPIKKDHLSVCSTTLWVGHLSKLVHQEDLSDTFGEFGEIVSIDLIIPRGCAFIVMDRRQDAARCLTKLKNHKVHGKALTLAWAPGKGVKGKDLKDYWEGDLGVSYIPFSKLKPDIEIEMLEDGGTIDEETMPAWLKTKALQASKKSQPMSESAEMTLTVPPPLISKTASVIDTTQPPPIPPGGGILQPPPMTLPLVPPYPLGRGLLGAVGMNLPPGSAWPNVPIGVPPPNLPGQLMTNQLLGIGSPFNQAPPGILQQAMPPMQLPGSDKNLDSSNDGSIPPPGLRNPPLLTLPQPFGLVPHQQPPLTVSAHSEENMDVEMEDAERADRLLPPPLSDQLLATLNSYNNTDVHLSAAVSRLHAVTNNRPNPGGLGSDGLDADDKRDRKDDRDRNRSRDRDRDRNRDRGRRNSFDRNKDRERDSSRGERREERRDRGNRWGERDHRENERDERRDREKALNDRLREMAGNGAYSNRNDDNDGRPPLLDRPMFPPPPFNNMGDVDLDPQRMDNNDDRFRRGPPDERRGPPDDRRGPLDDRRGHPDERRGPPGDRHGPPDHRRNSLDDRRGPPDERRGGPPDPVDERHGPPGDFDHRMRRPPPDSFPPVMDHPDFSPRIEGPPGFDGPPRPPPMHHEGIVDDRFGRRDRFGGDDRRMIEDFEPMMLGPPGPRPDFFPPRDGFGPPRGQMMMRGPRPDGFQPRGMMGRPPMFHPRGPHMPHMRGPRPGPPWMDGGGMRPNFQPRFDGPPTFRGPPGTFDDHHPRHRRFDDRRRFNKIEHEGFDGPPIEQRERPERRSRWGNSSPVEEMPFEIEGGHYEPEEGNYEPQEAQFEAQEGPFAPPEGVYEQQEVRFEPPEVQYEEPPAVRFEPPEGQYEPKDAHFEPPEEHFELPEAHFESSAPDSGENGEYDASQTEQKFPDNQNEQVLPAENTQPGDFEQEGNATPLHDELGVESHEVTESEEVPQSEQGESEHQKQPEEGQA